MATNQYLEQARWMTLPVPAVTVSGDPVISGDIAGVALLDAAPDNTSTVDTGGAYRLTVTGAVSTVGATLYATVDGGGVVTAISTTASGNKRYGYALATQAATGVLPVKIGY